MKLEVTSSIHEASLYLKMSSLPAFCITSLLFIALFHRSYSLSPQTFALSNSLTLPIPSQSLLFLEEKPEERENREGRPF